MNALRSMFVACAVTWACAAHGEADAKPKVYALISAVGSAIVVAKSIPVEKLAAMLEKFDERARARALNESIGEVIVKEPKVADPARAK